MWDDCSSARRSHIETTGSLELIYTSIYIQPKNKNYSTRSLLLLVPVLFIFVSVAIHIEEKEQTQCTVIIE